VKEETDRLDLKCERKGAEQRSNGENYDHDLEGRSTKEKEGPLEKDGEKEGVKVLIWEKGKRKPRPRWSRKKSDDTGKKKQKKK